MGRWLARLRDSEKKTQTHPSGTDKTDKTPPQESVGAECDQAANFATCSSEDDLAMWIEERAAILEYDEGLSRPEAERLAREQMANVVPLPRRRP